LGTNFVGPFTTEHPPEPVLPPPAFPEPVDPPTAFPEPKPPPLDWLVSEAASANADREQMTAPIKSKAANARQQLPLSMLFFIIPLLIINPISQTRSMILKTMMARNAVSRGSMAILNVREASLFHLLEADRTSIMQRRATRLITAIKLISDIPIEVSTLMAVAELIIDTTLTIDESISPPWRKYFRQILCYRDQILRRV
jgi:hypothetical protein